jgi:hypothetical protein
MPLQTEIDKIYPRHYDYDVNITKEQWIELLQDSTIFHEENIKHLKCLYTFENHAATSKEVSEKLGNTSSYYIGLANALAKRISKKLNLTNLPSRNNDADIYWYILFYGQSVKDPKRGSFEWKLKPNLADALKELYPELEYPEPQILKKLDDVASSVWLATAILAFETYHRYEKINKDALYFEQKEIQKRAQQLCEKNVNQALISQWFNADKERHTYNYLREGTNKTRRLTYPGEFNGVKEQPNLDLDNLVQTEFGLKSIREIKRFIEKDYAKLFKGESVMQDLTNIDCFSILDYLEKYANHPYESPEKADPSKQPLLLEIKSKGKTAVKELDKLAQICEDRFGFKRVGPPKWLNGGGNRTRVYLWRQLKYIRGQEFPTSLSLFAELVGGRAQFKISVEIDEKKTQKVDLNRHHLHLNRDIRKASVDLIYICKRNLISATAELEYVTEEVKQKVANGIYEKIEIARIINRDEINTNFQTNEELAKEILKAVQALVPYYELAIGEIPPPPGTEDLKGGKIKMNKNTILYGPPGTGKTYYTVLYAVSIIEEKPLELLIEEDYSAVFERYNTYKEEGKIAFTTFHQSYGYEEFIEGIKPHLLNQEDESTDSLEYKIESGIFKQFCDKARSIKIQNASLGINANPTIWKVSLKGAGQNEIKEDCFKNNRIRIGWTDLEKELTEESKFDSAAVKRILLNFQNEMKIGDIVLTLLDKEHIDGIGVITGDAEWLENGGHYPRSRDVQWIATNIKENIVQMNGGVTLTLSTVYRLDRINIENMKRLIEKYQKNEDEQLVVEENKGNYVFIIDEINRGNISKIFGELITLIEPTKRLGEPESMTIKLPYSGTDFGVPNNVYLIGTMNTADRSIALMDTALRRRFEFIEMMPNPAVLNDIPEIEGINIVRMLEVINERIEFLYDREHTIGHAYFTALAAKPTLNHLAHIFLNKIIPLLQDYFYEDYSKIQLVLGDNAKADKYKFILDTEKQIPDVFKGNPDIDLPENKYSIQKSAFYLPESYQEIY